MNSSVNVVGQLLFLLLALSCSITAAKAAPSPCSTSAVFQGHPKQFTHCVALPTQGASLAWTTFLTPDAGAGAGGSVTSELQVLFQGTAPSSSGWAGWGINPDALAMEGTQAFLAFQAPNGSTILPFNVARGSKSSGIKSGPVSLDVVSMAVEIVGTAISSLVTLRMDSAALRKPVNVVWNRGTSIANFRPASHGFSNDDLASMMPLDFTAAPSSSASGPNVAVVHPPHYELKIAHALLNTLGWGILLPIGVLAARYLKPLLPGPAWFYVHVTAQTLGFFLGAAGWATGMALGALSPGVVYRSHRCVGITAFSICLLQLLCTFLLRPKPGHHLRGAWNCFHYTLGLSTIALAVVNIFLGFDIMQVSRAWRFVFVGVLVGIVALAFLMELILCVRRMRSSNADAAESRKELEEEEADKTAADPEQCGVATMV